MNRKIKLLVIIPNKSGVGYYRSINPHTYLDEFYSNEIEVDLTEKFDFETEGFGEKYDLIHFHSNVGSDMGVWLNKMKELQSKGVKFIMDMDDYWVLPKHFPNHYYLNVIVKIQDNIKECARTADYITTTTEIFAKEIKKLNKNVFVLPNSIDERERQFQRINIKSNRLRVGIICGSSHEKDIELLTGVVNQLRSDIDKIQFVVCGFDLRGTTQYKNEKTGQIESRPITPDESVWTKYERILTDNYSIVDDDYKKYLLSFIEQEYPNVEDKPYRRCWTKPVNQYATHYNNIDVLLVPLYEDKFSEMKSQLKVVEAAFFKKSIIAQDFGPYKIDLDSYIKKGGVINEKGNALLVESNKNHKQWSKWIKFLLENPEHRNKMSDNLFEKITKEYSLSNTSKKRIELYKKIINKI